jgi:hypothetical protein
MLHRLRSVLVRPGRELLQGRVEVDETYIGGIEPGLSGGRAKGKKPLVGIAVERVEPRGFGRCRMAWLLDASGDTLRAFLTDHVQQGATVITDGWARYQQWHVDGKWSGWHPVVDGGKLGSGPTVLSSGRERPRRVRPREYRLASGEVLALSGP